MTIILPQLLAALQYQQKIINYLLNFICRFIPIKQWLFDDSHSPKYQKFTVDELPRFEPGYRSEWTFELLQEYYLLRYGKKVKPIKRRNDSSTPSETKCPYCGAPAEYIYKNNGDKGQLMCKVCSRTFQPGQRKATQINKFWCPHCGHALQPVKDRKHFRIHKCVNPKCSFYLKNLKKADKEDLKEEYGSSKYKLHYLYREFTEDLFKLDINSIPDNASTLSFSKFDMVTATRCLTLHVNGGLSTRRTAWMMKDLFGTQISHQQVYNYARTASMVIKPFVDTYDYEPSETLVADETYVKVKGVKAFIWFIMDSVKRSIIGYHLSDNRGVGPCILAMRQALKYFEKLPENFKFVADGYSAYPLAAQQFFLKYGEDFAFDITQVIGLANEDVVSTENRSFKQEIERLNRSFKQDSYHITNGYGNYATGSSNLALWVAYYNFLRPHKAKNYRVLNYIEELDNLTIMPDKWAYLILLGQQTIKQLQNEQLAS